MKKFLLSIALVLSLLAGRSQAVLNEVYIEPGNTHSEFFELYNTSSIVSENVDRYTLVTYWETSPTVRGFYVLDLPDMMVSSKGYFIGAANSPFNIQGGNGLTAHLNWNSVPASGYLQKWQYNSTTNGYDPLTPGNVQDLFAKIHNNYYILLFKNGIVVNGFIGSGSTGALPASITGLPALSVTPVTSSGSLPAFSIVFSNLPVVEFFNPSSGGDNGYTRTSDGKCGSWHKSAPQVQHTPGVTNGDATGLLGDLTTFQAFQCPSNQPFVQADVTAISGNVTEADDFPVTVQVYQDFDASNTLSPGDNFLNSAQIISVAQSQVIIPVTLNLVNQNRNVIVVYATKRGCFDQITVLANTCIPLPVQFNAFAALRTSGSVKLNWSTATERNNTGFAVERNINGTWQQIAWVPTQATAGNSDALLNYSYVDANSAKGVSQYRIRQVDLDGKASYSEIRSVRGEFQPGKTLVYPNPTTNGKVSILFEDGAVTRNVTVTDMSGRIVRQLRSVTTNNVSIEGLQPGMYVARIVASETGEQTIEKFVVNKQ